MGNVLYPWPEDPRGPLDWPQDPRPHGDVINGYPTPDVERKNPFGDSFVF